MTYTKRHNYSLGVGAGSLLSTCISPSSCQDVTATHRSNLASFEKESLFFPLDFEIIRQSAVLLGLTFTASDVQQVMIRNSGYTHPKQRKIKRKEESFLKNKCQDEAAHRS